MKKWQKYRQYLQKGDWHVHTNYTDGKNSIFEYCEKAEENELELIAFTEHVRRNLTYDFNDFISDVHSAKDRFDLIILGGCEAKVLNLDGELNTSKEILNDCEIVIGAFHGSFFTKKEYLIALTKMVQNPNVDIWAHPLLYVKKNNFNLNEYEIKDILGHCKRNDTLVELNIKHQLPGNGLIKLVIAKEYEYVIGSDAHTVTDLLTRELLESLRINNR
jgi:DNA polymerase (family 10)/putative hydrolase